MKKEKIINILKNLYVKLKYIETKLEYKTQR